MGAILNVFLHDAPVGRLWLDARRRFTFQYRAEWVSRPDRVPLSLSLPVRPEPYEDDTARPFFANLLPEADTRRAIARRLGLSERNDFQLLEAIGGECAGAVSVLPAGANLPATGEYRPLTEEALHELTQSLPVRPFLAGEVGVRLSLAGAQNKLPVYVVDDRVHLPVGAYSSSHILKPPIERLAGTVENEAFCMQLAARLGLTVPEARVRLGADRLYLVTRYDRTRDAAGRLRRLHQEDFCQALGVTPDAKYEKEGGPSLRECFALVRRASIQPAADLKALLRWTVFNMLIGNADAHAKNLALLLTEQGPRLAPFYDLLCTAVYPDLTQRLAMRIGGEDRPEWLLARRWRACAEELGIKPRLVQETVLQMAARIGPAAGELAQVFQAQYGSVPTIAAILKIIEARVQKAVRAFAAESEEGG